MRNASIRRALVRLLFLTLLPLLWAGFSGCSDDHSPGGDTPDTNGDLRDVDQEPQPDATGQDAAPPPSDITEQNDARSPRDITQEWDWGSAEDAEAERFQLDEIVPASGPVQGNNRVRLLGSGFERGTRVYIGRNEMSVDVTRSQIVGRAPAASAPGSATVRVIAPDGEVQALEDGYEYVAGLSVDEISPRRIPTRGGVELSIEGSGFSPDATVSFSSTPALRVDFVDSNKLRVLAPARPEGPADLRVTTRTETTRVAEAVDYYRELELHQVRPASGPIEGGEQVEISGAGWSAGMKFFFGDKPAELLSFDIDNGRATVLSPANAAGLVDVRAESEADDALLADAYLYRSDDAPTLAALSPQIGPTTGGTEVELRGFGLDGAGVEFLFGDEPATILSRGADWALVETPPASAGLVDVSMRDAQTEVGRLADAFEYQTSVQIDQISPPQGPSAGGSAVTIEGRGFSQASRVEFGGVAAQFEIISDTEILAQTPAHGAGLVDVLIKAQSLSARAEDAFEYLDELEIWGFSPIRGAIAGGTYMEMRGQGFRPGAKVFFDDAEASDIEQVDPSLIRLRTPAHPSGEAAVRVEQDPAGSADSSPISADAPYPFEYFNPSSPLGGASGESIDGSVNVSVFSRGAGPIPNAFVMLSTRADTTYQGMTDENGQITLSGPEVFGAQTVTATAHEYSSSTIHTVDAENITLFLSSLNTDMDEGSGSTVPAPTPPRATIRGEVTIQGKLADPRDHFTYDMAVVGTTRESIGSGQVDPGSGSIVVGSGPYEINSRVGDLATIALCGVYDEVTEDFHPQFMGIERHMVISDRQTARVDLTCDIPLDQTAKVKLVNPIYAPNGPNNNVAQIYWDFGIDGVFIAPHLGRGFGDILQVPTQPQQVGDVEDIRFSVTAGSFTGTAAPSTQATLHGVDSLDDLIVMPTLLGVPEPVSPPDGGVLEHNNIVFSIQETEQPDFYVVTMVNSVGLPFWEVILPGDQHTIRLPEFPDFSQLPEDQRPDPWDTARVSMTIIGIRAATGFNLEDFTYQDLSSDSWRAYSLTRWGFLPPGAD